MKCCRCITHARGESRRQRPARDHGRSSVFPTRILTVALGSRGWANGGDHRLGVGWDLHFNFQDFTDAHTITVLAWTRLIKAANISLASFWDTNISKYKHSYRKGYQKVAQHGPKARPDRWLKTILRLHRRPNKTQTRQIIPQGPLQHLHLCSFTS